MEVLVSRMKAYSELIRFVAVSATIPNACDFALWIGKRTNEPRMIGPGNDEPSDDAAQLYTFSEAFRPCPLKKVSILSGVKLETVQWCDPPCLTRRSMFTVIAIQERINGALTES